MTFGTAPQETKSGSYIYSGSPSGSHEWEFRTRVRVEFLQQKIRKKVLNISPNLCQLHWNEDVLRGAPSLDEEEMMEPRRPMRLEHHGDKENRAILEALRMDEEERSDYWLSRG